MSVTKMLSPSILKASEKAGKHIYDKSNYIVIDSNVRRDIKTGRLVSKSGKDINT